MCTEAEPHASIHALQELRELIQLKILLITFHILYVSPPACNGNTVSLQQHGTRRLRSLCQLTVPITSNTWGDRAFIQLLPMEPPVVEQTSSQHPFTHRAF